MAVFMSPVRHTELVACEDGQGGGGGETGQRPAMMPEENGLLLGRLSPCILLRKETDKNGCDVQFSQRGIFLCSRLERPRSW